MEVRVIISSLLARRVHLEGLAHGILQLGSNSGLPEQTAE